MPARLLVAVFLVLGLVEGSAPDLRLSADRDNSTIAGNEACALLPVPVAVPPNPPATVMMCGLDNPRGLAFSQSALYVAEAGRGGLGLVTTNCFVGQAGNMRCYAPNGAISRLWNGVQEQIATGFPSHANLMGRQAIGPHDIALVGGADVTIGLLQRPAPDDCHPACAYVTIGLQQPPVFRDRYLFLADFAKVARVLSTGEWSYVADLGAYETERDPDQAFYNPDKLDTNPYGLLTAPGRAVVAVDAGGNSALHVGANGDVSTLAAFGPHPDDSVPTSIDVGPDGAYYVGELTGFPVVPAAANVLRVDRAGGSPEVCLTGFTTIIDIAFDNRGNLYVLEYAGTLIRIAPDRRAARARDDRSVVCAQYAAGDRTTVVSGLTNPTSVAVGPDGALYVSNRGIFPLTGEVIRFEQVK
jgi:hypothetical protein